MANAQKLKVHIKPPEHGWIAIILNHGDASYQFFPSHIPHDSITELVNALLLVIDGVEACVRWNDEPLEHEFQFTPNSDETVKFQVVRLDSQPHAGPVPASVFLFTAPARDIVWVFWKALRDMESRQTHDEYLLRWGEPFPERCLQELTRRLKRKS